MPVFWTLAAAMVAFALILVLPPLLRHTRRLGSDRDATNIAIAQERLRELEDERNAGRMAAEHFQRARAELEVDLISDLSDGRSLRRDFGGRWAAALVAILVPLTALGLYLQLGSKEALVPMQENPAVEAASESTGSLEELATALAAKLEAEPDNALGWMTLGQAYAHMKRFAEAAAAYKKSRDLIGDHPDLLVAYADALARVHGNDLNGRPKALIDRALSLDPNHRQGLLLAAFASFQANDYEQAIEHWQQLLKDTGVKGPQRKLFERYIALAKTHREAATGSQDAVLVPQATPPSSIKVKVKLDPSLVKKTDPEDRVFVFARASDGPPMPLAVARTRVEDLPASLTLDDSMAMIPDMPLSRFSTVVVGARISHSGEGRAQSGDLQGMSGPVEVASAGLIEITIDEQIP